MVIWSENAINQFHAAYDYLLEVSGSNAAKRFVNKIENAAAKLAANPNMGTEEERLRHLPRSYRSLTAHRNYKIIYTVEKETIYITTLFDCRQNPDKIRKGIKK